MKKENTIMNKFIKTNENQNKEIGQIRHIIKITVWSASFADKEVLIKCRRWSVYLTCEAPFLPW